MKIRGQRGVLHVDYPLHINLSQLEGAPSMVPLGGGDVEYTASSFIRRKETGCSALDVTASNSPRQGGTVSTPALPVWCMQATDDRAFQVRFQWLPELATFVIRCLMFLRQCGLPRHLGEEQSFSFP